MDLRCSVTLSARRRFVSPTYKMAQHLQVRMYTILVNVHVKCSLKKLLLGPTTERSLSFLSPGQVLQLTGLHGNVPAGPGIKGWG